MVAPWVYFICFGGLHDHDTGFVRFGFRDYDPETGRFTALDPIGAAGGDDDWYGYCLDDPINAIDPLGLEGENILVKAFPAKKMDWCGSKDSKWVPDYPMGWNYATSCMNHDFCYGTSNKTQKECDDEFKSSLREECSKIEDLVERNKCRSLASFYHSVVRLKGEPAFTRARETRK